MDPLNKRANGATPERFLPTFETRLYSFLQKQEGIMTKRRFEVFEYRNVIVRMRLGDSDRQIAAAGLMGRHKAAGLRRMSDAKGWLDNGKPMPDNEQIAALFKVKPAEPNTSQVLPHADKVLKCIDQGISITAIHQMLMREYNFTGGYDAVRRFVRRHRKKTIKPTIILVFRPGEACQVDFGSGPKLTDELSGKKYKTWFFIMTLAFSRHQYVEFVTDQTVETWLGCHRRAFEFFGGVPEKAIIDNAKCAITKACFYDPIVQRAYAECAEGYGFLISPCPVAAPQKKGIVESGVNYVKRNFLPLRRFRNMVDMNQQALEWVMGQAGNRIHGTTHELPLSRFLEIEKSALKALPDVAPETAFWAKAKVHVNCHAMFQKSQYSVPFSLVHQDVWLRATESMVHIYHEEKLVAAHPRLCKPGSMQPLEIICLKKRRLI
jgi:transposase